MPDFEKELEATQEAAAATVRESERLADEASKSQKAVEEWKKANGIDAALEAKFFATLSPEELKKAAEEEETFNRELAHDLAAAVQRAFPTQKLAGTGKKRPRNMA